MITNKISSKNIFFVLSFFIFAGVLTIFGVAEDWLRTELSPASNKTKNNLLAIKDLGKITLAERIKCTQASILLEQSSLSDQCKNGSHQEPSTPVESLHKNYASIQWVLSELNIYKNKNEKEKAPFVAILEWLIFLCCWIQFEIILLSQICNNIYKKFESRLFYLTDWALNSPPVIGVLANLYAFGKMLSSGVTGIDKTFLTYFGEAVTTTLLGGLVYIIILFSRISTKAGS